MNYSPATLELGLWYPCAGGSQEGRASQEETERRVEEAEQGSGMGKKMTAEQAGHLHEMLRRFRREPETDWLSGIQVIEAVGETLGKGKLFKAIPAIAAWLEDANPEAAESAGKEIGIECLLDRIRRGRNRAVHEGTGAKRLTDDVSEALRIIEEGLVRTAAMTGSLRYYMVPDIIWAEPDESLRSVRNKMLRYELSALPVKLDGRYYWLKDSAIAEHVVNGGSLTEKPSQLTKRTSATTLEEGGGAREAAEAISRGEPGVLVTRGQGADVWVIGIVTAFDLMYAAPK